MVMRRKKNLAKIFSAIICLYGSRSNIFKFVLDLMRIIQTYGRKKNVLTNESAKEQNKFSDFA